MTASNLARRLEEYEARCHSPFRGQLPRGQALPHDGTTSAGRPRRAGRVGGIRATDVGLRPFRVR
jgi:hypothetical protein